MVRPKLVQFNFLKLLTAAPDTNSMLLCTPLQILLKIAAFMTQIPDSFETDAKTHTDFTRSASSTEKEKFVCLFVFWKKGKIKFFIFPLLSVQFCQASNIMYFIILEQWGFNMTVQF